MGARPVSPGLNKLRVRDGCRGIVKFPTGAEREVWRAVQTRMQRESSNEAGGHAGRRGSRWTPGFLFLARVSS